MVEIGQVRIEIVGMKNEWTFANSTLLRTRSKRQHDVVTTVEWGKMKRMIEISRWH